MNRFLILGALAFATAFCALTTTAHAQATRTWVSGVGDDANPCSRTAPCKTWAGAISKTAAGGEIDALDPGGFGALTITKSITLDGGGGQVASVLVAGTNGISISAATNDVVTIRNLRFDGLLGNGSTASPGLVGINVGAAAQVNIEHCYIFGFKNAGINYASSGSTTLNVTDTVLENNAGGGVIINGNSNKPLVAIESSRILGNGTTTAGVEAINGAHVTVANTLISGNEDGVFSTGAGAVIFVYDSTVTGNLGNGLHATLSGAIDAAGSAISLNQGMGVLSATGGGIGSWGTNILLQNAGGNGTFLSNGNPQSRFHLSRPPN